jgi:hypothetical protein
MIHKNRDSKFIIYQVLYILLITIIALKGAELDLSRVVKSDQVVDVSVKDSLQMLIDSLYAAGLSFDIKIDENVSEENQALKDRLATMQREVQQLTTKIREIPAEERVPVVEERREPEVRENTRLSSPIALTQTFIRHTWNEAQNSGSVPTEIIDPKSRRTLAVIPPGQSKKFDLDDQEEVIVKFGSQEERIKVLPNRPPEVRIERVTTRMNQRTIYVQELQRTTVFKVTIIDERPEQLKVVHSGPISVTGPERDSKGNLVYNVSLNLAPTEARYEEWLDRNSTLRESDGRYKVNFFFTVLDERSKDKVQVGDSFFFTEFGRR